MAQNGGRAANVKPLKGIAPGARVLEVIEPHDGDTYRAVYTVRFEGVVYVLHAFKKKSQRGIRTPKREVDLIRSRYRDAAVDFEARGSQ